MKSRTLVLRREELTELSTNDLTSIAAAAAAAAGSGSCITFTVIPTGCGCTGIYPSLNEPCTQDIVATVYSYGC